MTTMTTAAGMTPLAFATGEGSSFWQPIGRAALGGVLFAMLVTLVLIPAIYFLTEGWRGDPSETAFDEEDDEVVPDADGSVAT
jgi:HAE1 family hydrophobic/amphiphilic exporter-1